MNFVYFRYLLTEPDHTDGRAYSTAFSFFFYNLFYLPLDTFSDFIIGASNFVFILLFYFALISFENVEFRWPVNISRTPNVTLHKTSIGDPRYAAHV